MTRPTATYRLQLRNEMTFARAAAQVGYLGRLGISHLYVSPLFAAVPGSSHGYDGVDVGTIEPAIGGDEGFERLCTALGDAGLGLIVDFVPNHMAAADQNAWWQGVLEWGTQSPFAEYFDIDWSQPKLLLPILGSTYADALANGELGIGFDAANGEFFFACYDRRLPLTPPTYALVLERADSTDVAGLAKRFAASRYQQSGTLKNELARCAADSDNGRSIERAIAAVVADRERLHRIHEAQIWRLVHWSLAREALTYRRFFEIAELICLRVEDAQVFEAVHERLFQLIAAGKVSGVRFDHIDGLADPKSYLERFCTHVGAASLYLLVEKIIEPGERLRGNWPVDGTTGYEFIAALASVFVDRRREAAMQQAYEAFTGERTDYAVAASAAKGEIFERNLAAELAYLTEQAVGISVQDPRTRVLAADRLRHAIVAIAAALPVYRTYVDESGPDVIDREVIVQAAQAARASCAVENTAAVDFIERLLLVDADEANTRDSALAFAMRFQQTSGPVMAKAIEDTLFYRYNRLIALNEVGGSPERYGAPLTDFHASMSERQRTQPGGLSATATHDTKRGEDARARLYVLSEMPQRWYDAVVRWSGMNAPHRTNTDQGAVPEPATEWLFYQALAGVWPAGLSAGDELALGEVRSRMLSYMTKAAREAKTHTSWTGINEEYERALGNFAAATLSIDNAGFLENFVRTCHPVWVAGAINSLAQLAIKLMAPGVPDFYQGSELWDLSLVDPDNRSPVDFAARDSLLNGVYDADARSLLGEWESGAPKLFLAATGLHTRTSYPDLFADGDYVPLSAAGARGRHLVAFARVFEEQCAMVVVPRFVLDLTVGTNQPLVPPARWGDTGIELPTTFQARPLRDTLTGVQHQPGALLSASSLLDRFPVALLVAEAN